MGPRGIALLLAVAALLSPRSAAAQAGDEAPPAEALAEIREQVLYAQYREAIAALEGYLERDDLDAAGRNAGLEVLATVQIARRQERRARETLAQLYARDPGHRLSEADPSPPVLSAFGRARENPPPPASVSLEHEPPVYDERVPPALDVSIGGAGADAVQELRLRYRQGDATGFSTVVMDVEGGRARARIPLLGRRDAYEVEYAIEAAAPSGAVLASAGSEAAPLRIGVPEAPAGTSAVLGVGTDEPDSMADTDEGGSLTWLWVTLGVVVVAGAVTAAVVIASSGGPEDGSLGNVALPLVTF